MGCVYIARNKVNGKAYVGKTSYPLRVRKSRHRRDALSYGSGTRFSRAIRKYGWDAFEWRELHQSDDDTELMRVEVEMVATFKSKSPSGYNLTDGGEGRSGHKNSADHNRKIAAAHRANGVKKRLLNPRPIKTGTKGENISKAKKGKIPTRTPAAEAAWARQKGRSLTASHCAAISASGKGKKHNVSKDGLANQTGSRFISKHIRRLQRVWRAKVQLARNATASTVPVA